MEEKVIIEQLINEIKNGKITLEEIPEVWRVKVEEKLERENG